MTCREAFCNVPGEAEDPVSFRPINPRNAILEAVVVVHLSRPALDFESAAVRALHPRLARDLPRLDDLQVGTFHFGSGGPPPHLPGAPVVMAAYKKDGTIETRLLLNGPILTVNFLLYTRWSELWPKAAVWIQEMLDAIAAAHRPSIAPPLSVAALAHQIIDVFLWSGVPGDVSVADLFNDGPPRLPSAVWAAVGSPWYAAHSTSEPFTPGGLPLSALVDSLSVNLSEEQNVGWRLRLEHLVEARFGQPLSPTRLFAQARSGGTPQAETIMDGLHARNHALMRSLLRPKVLTRIGMDAS